jgi:hypothetical protein
MKEGFKPFKQKLRKIHPTLEPLFKKELKNILDTQIIFKVNHSTWVSNMVPVKKNSREVRLCIDFQNLNRDFDKENCLVPPMKQILQLVSGSKIFSLLDEFS